MSEQSKSANYAQNFSALRKHAREVFTSRLVKDAQDVKNLSNHIKTFHNHLKEDVKNHGKTDLKRDIRAFEGLLHDELDYLFAVTKQDIKLFGDTLKLLSKFRNDLKNLLEDPSFTSLAQSELNYANLLEKTADEKVQTLQLLFKKLKN